MTAKDAPTPDNVVELNTVLRRFVERRETGKPPTDAAAEQLAMQAGELAGELERGVG